MTITLRIAFIALLNELSRLDVPRPDRRTGGRSPGATLTILAELASAMPAGIRCRVRGKEGPNGGRDHVGPAQGACRLQGAERPGDQPVPWLGVRDDRHNARRGDEDQLASGRGAEIRLRHPRRSDPRPEARAAVGL